MSTDATQLAKSISEVGEKFDKSLAELRAEFKAAEEAGTAQAGDVKSKLEQFSKEFADNAATLSDLKAKAEADAKAREELEAKVIELQRKGIASQSDDAEYVAAAMHLAAMQDENKGESTIRFADEDGALPTRKEVELADIAFQRYALGGVRELPQSMPAETLAVGSGIYSPSYGIFLPAAVVSRVISELYTAGSLRGLALMRTVSTDSAKILRASGKTTVKVGRELADYTPGDLPAAYSVEYPIVDFESTISLHANVMEDSQFGLVDFLTGEARMSINETESNYHVNGDGVNKPVGFLTLDKDDTAIGSVSKTESDFGTIRAVNTGNATGVGHATASNAAFAYNPLIAAIASMHSRYRMNARILMNRLTFSEYARLRDADGNYLAGVAPSMNARMNGGAMNILGTPVVINDFMPDVAANAYPVAVADWMQAYEVATRRGIRMLVDPYSSKPDTEYSITMRAGGRPSDTRAIRLLKCAA